MNTLYSHKFGDQKGRRLTIGCQVLKKSDKTTTYLVTKSTCRKTDMFSKEVGRKIVDFRLAKGTKDCCTTYELPINQSPIMVFALAAMDKFVPLDEVPPELHFTNKTIERRNKRKKRTVVLD